MILVAKAVVDERAVVVEALHALIAVVAMHAILRVQILAVDTNVVKMKLFVNETLHETQEVFLERHVPRVYQRHAVEEDGQDEEDCVENHERHILVLRLSLKTRALIIARCNDEE